MLPQLTNRNAERRSLIPPTPLPNESLQSAIFQNHFFSIPVGLDRFGLPCEPDTLTSHHTGQFRQRVWFVCLVKTGDRFCLSCVADLLQLLETQSITSHHLEPPAAQGNKALTRGGETEQ